MTSSKTKAVQKTGKKTKRIPRYQDKEGLYLVIDDRNYDLRISWYIPYDEDYGLYLANEDRVRGEDKETNIAIDVLRKYWISKGWTLPDVGRDFVFNHLCDARAALRLINTRLHYEQESKPLPKWAKTAIAAGWSPPKGWKP